MGKGWTNFRELRLSQVLTTCLPTATDGPPGFHYEQTLTPGGCRQHPLRDPREPHFPGAPQLNPPLPQVSPVTPGLLRGQHPETITIPHHLALSSTQNFHTHRGFNPNTPGVMVNVSIYKMVKDMRPSMEVLKAVFEVDKGLRMEEGWLFSPAPPSTSAPLYTCPDSVSGQSYLACKTWHVSVPWPRTHDCCLCITLLDLLGLFSCPSTSSRKPS